MNANFDKLRLRYKEGNLVDVLLELTSINFDVNHTTVEPNTPFTTEMSFDLKIAELDNLGEPVLNILPTDFGGLNLNQTNGFTGFLQNTVFRVDNAAESNIKVEFLDMATGQAIIDGEAIFPLRHSAVILQSFQDENTLASHWQVKLKFLGSISIADASVPAVFYPSILFNENENEELVGPLYPENTIVPDVLLDAFNSDLKTYYELLVLAPGNGSVATNSIGRVADEISDSFANLGNVLAGKLGNTINARLQPSASPITHDIALWARILMGTRGLAFDNYASYMDAIFCGIPNASLTNSQAMKSKVKSLSQNRALPFMGVDAYRSIKTATEAFVMVNCSTDAAFSDADLQLMNNMVPLTNGTFDNTSLQNWWNTYRSQLYNLDSNETVNTIPYLATIMGKIKETGIKTTAFDTLFEDYAETGVTEIGGNCYGAVRERLMHPCFLELIWSYWHEESMMVQGLNAIGRRFQNIKGPGAVDPLANLEIDPLRPLSNILWGYLQDEQHRLTVRRRAYEYDHHYGISLQGSAVQNMRFADSRSKFIEAFHMLLHLTSKFYTQMDDLTISPDGFPILNALRETHLILSEGAHNQYGELPSVARAEMLMQQWLLARPEFREFLPTRVMVAYPEPWMDRVAALNNTMGWTKTNVMHFRDLGIFGEQLLLAIRFGNWANINDSNSAANWARFWRSQVQSYIHAYRAVTGVDLTADPKGGRVDALPPSVHLHRRWLEQRGKVA